MQTLAKKVLKDAVMEEKIKKRTTILQRKAQDSRSNDE